LKLPQAPRINQHLGFVAAVDCEEHCRLLDNGLGDDRIGNTYAAVPVCEPFSHRAACRPGQAAHSRPGATSIDLQRKGEAGDGWASLLAAHQRQKIAAQPPCIVAHGPCVSERRPEHVGGLVPYEPRQVVKSSVGVDSRAKDGLLDLGNAPGCVGQLCGSLSRTAGTIAPAVSAASAVSDAEEVVHGLHQERAGSLIRTAVLQIIEAAILVLVVVSPNDTREHNQVDQ
jgi:hypothetical protein